MNRHFYDIETEKIWNIIYPKIKYPGYSEAYEIVNNSKNYASAKKLGLKLDQTQGTEIPEIDNYEENFIVLEFLGEGADGWAWKVKRINDDKIVVLKMGSKYKIKHEIKILKELSFPECHPFLTCYYSHKCYNDYNECYLEMEFLSGKTLRVFSGEFMEKNQYNILYEKLLFIISDIVKAIKFIHSKDIIHNDINVLNIIINDEYIPKLIDFGRSCFVDECYKMFGDYLGFDHDIKMLGETLYQAATDKIYNGNKLNTSNKKLNFLVNAMIENQINSDEILKFLDN